MNQVKILRMLNLPLGGFLLITLVAITMEPLKDGKSQNLSAASPDGPSELNPQQIAADPGDPPPVELVTNVNSHHTPDTKDPTTAPVEAASCPFSNGAVTSVIGSVDRFAIQLNNRYRLTQRTLVAASRQLEDLQEQRRAAFALAQAQLTQVQDPGLSVPVPDDSNSTTDAGDAEQLVYVANSNVSLLPVAFLAGTEVVSLQPGEQRSFAPPLTIQFDRGGEFGQSSETIEDGKVEFQLGNNGWVVVRQ